MMQDSDVMEFTKLQHYNGANLQSNHSPSVPEDSTIFV